MLSDTELERALLDGSEAAFATLVARQGAVLRRFARIHGLDAGPAEEVVVDAITAYLASAGTVVPVSPLAVRLVRLVHPLLHATMPVDDPGPCGERITHEQHEALLLHDAERWSAAHVCAALGLRRDELRRRLSVGRIALGSASPLL